MSTSSNVSLGALRLQAKFRSDMENNPAVSDAEWNSYITNSRKELFDIQVAAYGNSYFMATTYQFSITNAQLYPFPDGTPSFINSNGQVAAKFYKLCGVDLQYSASPSGWITLKRSEFIERNKYGYPNSAINFNGYSNLRYNIVDDNLFFMPVPMSGQQARIWYVPAPKSLQFMLSTTLFVGSASFTLSDVTGLQNGMNVYATTGLQAGTVVTAINSTTGLVSLSLPATSLGSQVVCLWSDATTVDGIAGWEEYIIVDSAIKAQIKQENDITALALEKEALRMRIEGMAEGRDIGQAFHTSDALSVNGYGFDGMGGGWFGDDGF